MTHISPKPYVRHAQLSKKIQIFESVLSLLHWDQETYMPTGSLGPRIEQIAELSDWIHQEKTSRKYKASLEKLISTSTGRIQVKGLSKKETIACKEWYTEWLKNTRLPSSFVREFSQLTTTASQVWVQAKKTNQFSLFAPFLEKLIHLSRKKTELLGFEEHPYDALLEGYEPCMTTHKVSVIFSDLKIKLNQLLKKIRSSKQMDSRFLKKKLSDATQDSISQALLSILPANPAYTRLDRSAHPFSMAMHPHDSRITTRFLPDQYMSNIFSILHETGHSLYEMGLPTEHWGTPLAKSVSLTVHESQSRFWETLIGKSYPFWKLFYPSLQKEVSSLKKISLDRFYKAIHHVAPSFIRVEADEVTYCLHVILRFELEKQLIEGTLQVHDLPEAWNAKSQELLGITPPSDSLGCLQDVHWSCGMFGYFPTYALGNLFAAQCFKTFTHTHPDWEIQIASGNLSFIYAWLKNHIHQYGQMYDAETLLKKVTKKPLDASDYCRYLTQKYQAIYRF